MFAFQTESAGFETAGRIDAQRRRRHTQPARQRARDNNFLADAHNIAAVIGAGGDLAIGARAARAHGGEIQIGGKPACGLRSLEARDHAWRPG